MQIDRVRHHRRTDHADREGQRMGVRQAGNHRADGDVGPIHRRDEHLREVADADDQHQGADRQFDRPEAAAVELQDGVGQGRDDDHSRHQRHMKQQRKADGAADEFGQIGRHRRPFAHRPHRHHHGRGELIAAMLGQIAPRDDAELGRQRLKQHRHDIGEQHHPQQRIAIGRAGLNVGREIAGVHIGDRGDDGGTGEQHRRRRAAQRLAAQPVANGERRPIRQRRSLCIRHGFSEHWRQRLIM